MESIGLKYKAWEEENKPVLGSVVNTEYAKIIVDQLEVTLEEAEDALRVCEDNLEKALVHIINN